jgi:DNA-binding NtrC family response regulator
MWRRKFPTLKIVNAELQDKLHALERIEKINSSDAGLLILKFDLLKDVALQLVEEIESYSSLRTVNLSRGISLPDELRAFETHLIQSALERTGGHQTKAAQMLGINLTTLHNKLKRLNISPGPVVEAPILHEDLPLGISPSDSRVN